MKLHELKPAEGSRKERNRVGRGVRLVTVKQVVADTKVKSSFRRWCKTRIRRWSITIIPSFTKTWFY